VVDVPVEDENAFGAARASMLGSDGDVVDEAEPHRLFPLRVVPRRSQGTEGSRVLARQQSVNGVASRPGCAQGGLP
jgi:hypothetical protein